MYMENYLRLFLPRHSTSTFTEKFRSGMAGGLAILWLGLLMEFLPSGHYHLLMLASMGASTVLLFAAPHSPMAQPWNLVIGHLVSALLGWLVGILIADTIVAAAIAVGLAILFMHLLDALHPPGAATALSLVLSSVQFHHMGGAATVAIILVNVGFILLLALLINNLIPGRRYPMPIAPAILKTDCVPLGVVTLSDIQQALREMNLVIDANEYELLEITRCAVRHAYEREVK